jgi:predicted nucleic acid-binding protein
VIDLVGIQHRRRRAAPKPFYVPKILDSLPVLRQRPSLDLIINLRGQMNRSAGKIGDGIIGAQAIEFKMPLVTNDRELIDIVRANGGTVR